ATGFIAGKDEHALKLLAMAERGELNWSSGSVGHLVAKSPAMEATHIDEWPIAEVSLCPQQTVAEPRNVVSLKSLCYDDVPDFNSIELSPFSQSREAEVYLQKRVREAKQRAMEIYARLLVQQHEMRMRELLCR